MRRKLVLLFLLGLTFATSASAQHTWHRYIRGWNHTAFNEDVLLAASLGGLIDTGPIPDCGPAKALQGGDGTCVDTLIELNAAGSWTLADGAHTPDQVGLVTLNNICNGDGAQVVCDIANATDLNNTLGSNFLEGTTLNDQQLCYLNGSLIECSVDLITELESLLSVDIIVSTETATTSTVGVVELATQAEVDSGVGGALSIRPQLLQSALIGQGATSQLEGTFNEPTLKDDLTITHLQIEGVLDIGTVEDLASKGAIDVSTGSLFQTSILDSWDTFSNGTEDGHTIRIRHLHDVTIECGLPAAGNIECGTTDINTDAGDITEWDFDGTTWTLLGFVDDDEDHNSTKAEAAAAAAPAAVTYENLDANGDIGFGPGQVPQGSEVSTQVTFEALNANADVGFGASQVPEGSLTAPLASPALTGDPTRAVDPGAGDASQSIPTTNWVDNYFGAMAAAQTWVGTNTFEDLFISDGAGNDANIYNNSVGFYIRPDAQDSIYVGYDHTPASTPTGADNVVLGGRAGAALTTANHNTLVGAYAGGNLTTTGTRNTFIGRNAGGGVTGFQNVAVGWGALSGSGAINYSTAVGYNAGASLTTGTNNLFFGYTSGPLLTQGSYNLIMGGGNNLTTGSYNIVLGDQALYSVSTNSDNIGIGYRSNRFQTGSRNIAIGSYAGAGINGSSTGSGNILIGDWAGNGLTTGAGRNIFIGEDAGRYQTTAADTLIIDNRDQGSAANELVNGLVVGTFNATRTSQRLRVNGALSGMKRVVVSTGNYTVPYEEMLGTFHVADHTTPSSDVDYTLPTAEVGLNACFYDNGGGDGGIIIDAAAGDEILLNGSGIGVADAINSPGVGAPTGANGDYICIQAIDATYWVTLDFSGTWVDGGP